MPVTCMSLEMQPGQKNIFVGWYTATQLGAHKPCLATATTPKIGRPWSAVIKTCG
jgi:hypothetical protein